MEVGSVIKGALVGPLYSLVAEEVGAGSEEGSLETVLEEPPVLLEEEPPPQEARRIAERGIRTFLNFI